MQFSARVGFWVRYHRLKRKWSVRDACDRSGISRTTWYLLENGDFSQMAGGWIDTLAATFGLDVQDLAAQIAQGGKKYVGVDAKSARKRTAHRRHHGATAQHPRRPRAAGVRRAKVSKDPPR